MVDVAELGFEVDTAGLSKGEKALDKLENQAKLTTKATDRLTEEINKSSAAFNNQVKPADKATAAYERTRKASKSLGFGIQNAGFQLQDIAVQLEMGTDASRVFAQQFPQLISGFGGVGTGAAILASGLGAAVAVGAALIPVLTGSGEEADKAKDRIKDYEDALDSLKDVSKELRVEQAKLAGAFSDMRIFDAETQVKALQTTMQELVKTGKGAPGLMEVFFGSESDRTETFKQLTTLMGALAKARQEFAELERIGLAEDVMDLREELDPSLKLTNEYAENLELITKAWGEGQLTGEKYDRTLALLNQRFAEEKEKLDENYGILKKIQEPMTEYVKMSNSLNQLWREGKINLGQLNEELAKTALSKSLRDVDKSLTGSQLSYQAEIQNIRIAEQQKLNVVQQALDARIISEEEATRRIVQIHQNRQMAINQVMGIGNNGGFDSFGGNMFGNIGPNPMGNGPFSDMMKYEQDLILLQDAEARKTEAISAAIEERAITEQEGADRITQIHQHAQEQRDNIIAAQNQALLIGASSTFDNLSLIAKGFAGEQSGIYKAMFAASKAFAIAESIIAIQTGMAKALDNPWPINLAAMASVAAAGASIISNIQSVATMGFADGGFVSGPGGPRSDSIPARLSDGEFVVNAAATKKNRPMLEAINSGKKMMGGGTTINIQNYAGVDIEATQITESEVLIIARRAAKQVVREDAPQVIAADLSNPNSRTSRSIGQNTNAQRKR